MPTEPEPLTFFDVVHRAVTVCDQSGVDADLGELLERFEDADEPIGDPDAARDRLQEETGALDPQAEDGPIQLASAVATYLCYRRDQAGDEPLQLIRRAVGAEFDGKPPESVRQYLAESGIEV